MQLSMSAQQGCQEQTVALGPREAIRPLHRLKEARRAEGISRRTMAKRMHTDVDAIAQQEDADRDLTLSTLYQWQEILKVPLCELLLDPDDSLSPTVGKRAQMVRIMKTAKAILAQAGKAQIRHTAQMLVEQLIELMPELGAIQPWNEVGQRRTSGDLGAAYYRGLNLEAALGQRAQDVPAVAP